jgi:DNA repair exonuclease SbcCD nuclease subunit/energy-coupling factor transporter ATP-binding protein EcfA2
MKIVAIADLHLSDHKSLGIDETGRSIFLRKTVALAEGIKRVAEDFNADFIAIAGDFFDTPVLTPSVADAGDEIVRILSDISLILTAGQHDSNTKTPELFPYHTHLSRFKSYPNVVFADKFDTVNVRSQKVCVAPWNPEHALPPEDGDVFIGHGAVQGCRNLEGYRFNSGFRQDDLFKRFRLSIIGDIHNGQVFESSDRRILIPGTPVQFSWKDSPTTGIWLCQVPDEGPVTCEFTSSESICPFTFPKYLFTDNPEQKSTSLRHFRYRPPKESKTETKVLTEFKKDTSSITEIGLSIIKKSKIDNQDLVSSIFQRLIESLPSTDRKVPRSVLHSIEIHNFLSIEDFQIDFKEFPDNLIITGKNGSGKSSLVEAIFWCLTGCNTKGIPVNNVRNWYGPHGTWVNVLLEVEDTMYKIGRGRADGPNLQIFMFTDKWTPYTGSKTSCTQDVIYELLGISEWEIKLLSYFPASNPNLFGSIGKSDRYSLLSTVVGMSTIDTARDKMAELIKVADREVAVVESRIRTLREVGGNTKARLQDYMASRDSQTTTDTKDMQQLEERIRSNLAQVESSEKIREKIGLRYVKSTRLLTERNGISSNINNLQRTVDTVQKDVANKKQALAASLEGKCPTCGQSLFNDDVVNNLTTEIESLRGGLPDTELIKSLLAGLIKKDVEIKENEEALNTLKSELEKSQDLETSLYLVMTDIAKAKEGMVNYEPLIQAETQNFEKYKADITQEETRFDTLARLQEVQNWIHKTLLKRNGLLMSELAKQGQRILQDQVDMLTDGESFSVTVEDDLSIAGSFLGRRKADYSELSTGQARVIDIVMMVALNNLFTQIYGLDSGVLGLVIFDEVLSFLDPAYSDFCFQLINRANVPKRIVISHDVGLISRFNSEINVTLGQGESSSVYRKNWS